MRHWSQKELEARRITQLAMRLRAIFVEGRPAPRWTGTPVATKDDWRRVAEYVLANYTCDVDYKMPPYMGEAAFKSAQARRRAAKPKSCRLVDGKVVCK